MLRFTLPTLGIVGLAALTGCPDREVSRVDPIQDPVLDKSIPVNINRNLDIIFLVDNSGSMLAEQQQLTANFPEFINVLQQIEGGLPDIHLGVISSNVGAAGAASVPGCPASGDDGNLLTGPPGNTCASTYGLQGSFISDIAQQDGSRMRNYTGDLAQLFTCMASLGTSGCGFEMPLESMYRALQPGKNPGFYRDEAYLAVIFLSDEDDCSTEMGAMFGDPNAGISSQLGPRTSFRCHEFGVRCDNDPNPRALGPKTGCEPDTNSVYEYEVQRYIDFMRNLKDDPKLVIVAGIIGNFDAESGDLTVVPDRRNNDPNLPEVQISCFTRDPNDADDGAYPPVRLQSFLTAFPERNTFTTICNENLSDALIQIAELLKTAIGNPCIDKPLADRNPNIDGLQPECSVVDALNPDSNDRTETVIPQCSVAIQTGATCDPGSAGTPCWCIHPDATQCPADADNPQSYSIEVNRGGATPPLGTVLEVQCVTE
ncbi:MAG: VWA domain-containing protein [Kofleriaceae bacterium]|nr:MAG: VWA domain-containing protein [Kofleriaceae bacterium]MBZ0232145.1 VWA domain-containing protein [Kofleriaceae bacterium]